MKANAAAIWNPLSNGRLASGLADVPKYLKAGLTVGMGLDGQNTADLANPFENMRMGLYNIRMKYESASILGPLDVLKLHTIGTARAIGVADQVGSLKPGKYADFLIVDLGDPDTVPPTIFMARWCLLPAFRTFHRSTSAANSWRSAENSLKHDTVELGRDVRARMEKNRATTARMLGAAN